MVHWPAASVFGPAVVHVPVGAAWAAPSESVRVTSTCSPAAATKLPVPVSFSRVTVKVCGALTSLVALGAIEIRASVTASGSHAPVEAVYVASPR